MKLHGFFKRRLSSFLPYVALVRPTRADFGKHDEKKKSNLGVYGFKAWLIFYFFSVFSEMDSVSPWYTVR